MEPITEENDKVNCAVCGKWQPDALNLQLQIQLVNWGQCDECGAWVHLKFCSAICELNDAPCAPDMKTHNKSCSHHPMYICSQVITFQVTLFSE